MESRIKPSHYIELTVATTQFFARSVFVKAARWESNWAQEEEEVHNEQSEVIQTFPVLSDNLVDSFMEIWPHLFFQVNNPKPQKVKSSWNRENIRLTGQDGFKKKVWQQVPLTPLSLLWLLSELFCCDSNNFHHLCEVLQIWHCLF